MTTAQMTRKLTNAIRDYRGCKTTSGSWFRPPNPSAMARISRWLFRLQQKGALSEEQVYDIKMKLVAADRSDKESETLPTTCSTWP